MRLHVSTNLISYQTIRDASVTIRYEIMSTIRTQEAEPTAPTETTSPRALFAALGLIAVAAIGSYAIPAGFSALYTALGQDATLLLTTVSGIVATLFLGGLAFAYHRTHSISIPVRRPTGREWAWIAGGLILSLAAAIVFAILESVFAVEAATSAASSAAVGASTLTVALAAVYFMLVIGPIEEYLYRGVIQGRLRQSFGPALAIGITSVGFAIGHLPNLWLAGSNPLSAGVAVTLAGIAVGAVIMGAIYERTANLTVVIVIHGLINALFFGVMVVLAG